ncbi:Hypothetical predicted protein [Pelobates cultripes]|uniref:Uncharacterized protein n=1 Tax=Pelobates cultripes TaxID=61616 RepID=A0AAD1SLG2_PELCU|nr:Hypothetical predicted protein [Pelobates cultripes]
MSHSKQKRQANKADKLYFFGQKQHSVNLAAQTPSQDGGDDPGSPLLEMDETSLDDTLTKQFFLDHLTAQSKQLMTSWSESIERIRKDIGDIGIRISQIEEKMEGHAEEHNGLEAQVRTLQSDLHLLETKLMDAEDRSRRNNLHLIGIPESPRGPPYIPPRIPALSTTQHPNRYATA